MIICTKCIYDERTPSISFDNEGVCNCCRQVENLAVTYKTGLPEGKGNKYDGEIGVSGGTDFSYLLIKALEWGLKPIAVSSKLNIDLYTYVADNIEADDIFKSFLLDGVPEKVSDECSVPIIAHDRAVSIAHTAQAVHQGGTSAVALESMVVYQQKDMGVLINFPDREHLNSALI